MKKSGQKWILSVFLMACCLLFLMPAQANAASKKAKSISLNKTAVTKYVGQKFTLKATIRPEAAAGVKVTWTSSNKKVATVSAKGKVTLVAPGTAKITARTKNGKKAYCTVKALQYTISGSTLKIATPDGIKTYHAYSQKTYSYVTGDYWYRHDGCVTTAISIVASGYGKTYSPVDIHAGSATKSYSERYAVTKMGKTAEMRTWYGNTAISVRTASAILTNMGIENRAVYSYDRAKALKEIRSHLKEGKPVIIKANSNRYNGIRIANPHHAVVIVGVDASDRAICISPGSPQYYTTITLPTLLYHHMTPASGNYMSAYITDLRTAGGYILIEGVADK